MTKTKLFQALIGKISQETFFQDYWGKNWLLLKKEESPAQNFPISVGDLDAFFSNIRLRHPWVKVVNKGNEVPLWEYRNEQLSQLTDIVDNDRLFEQLNKGATIVANSIDKNYGPIGMYCRALEKELAVKVWANLYISPPKSRGFGIHQDLSDVIVVQISGKKNWNLYPREVIVDHRPPGPDDVPEAEFQLQEGEVLYLPKNHPHMAYSVDDAPSVHISLDFEGLFWSDLVKQFAKQAEDDIDFQQRVPIPLEGKEAFEKFTNAFQEKWAAFNQTNHPLDQIEHLNSATYHQKNAQKQNSLSDWLKKDNITAETYLKKSSYVAHELKEHGKTVHLLFQNKKIVFPFFIAPFISQLLREEPFRLSEIDAPQSDQEKIALAKKLVQEGILTIVD